MLLCRGFRRQGPRTAGDVLGMSTKVLGKSLCQRLYQQTRAFFQWGIKEFFNSPLGFRSLQVCSGRAMGRVNNRWNSIGWVGHRALCGTCVCPDIGDKPLNATLCRHLNRPFCVVGAAADAADRSARE